MKVLYILRYFPTLSETFVNLEIEELRAQGIEVEVASLGTRADSALAHPPDVPVHRIPRRLAPWTRRGPASSPGARWLAGQQRPRDVRRYRWLAAQMARIQPDRIHVHFAGEAAEFAHALHLDTGHPVSLMLHAVDLFKPRPSMPTLVRSATPALTIAAHHQAHLQAKGLQAKLLHCGPRLADWRLPPPPEGPIRALTVARAVPKKGLDTLLAAWVDAPKDAELTLISDLQAGTTAVGGLPPRVRLLPLCPPDGVRAALAASNLFILPCQRAPDGDMDGIPIVLMEALAACRPIISTPVSGIPELMDGSIGWWTEPEDPAALAAAIRAADDSGARRSRGLAGPGRLRSRGFTLTDQVAGLRAYWGS
jgi:colanic acid/amylovoran biosynthesis glycosyltransferase